MSSWRGAAALRGYEAQRRGDPPRIGYLAGLKALQIIDRPRIGESVGVEIHHTFALDSVTIMEGTVLQGDKVLASGTLKVWEADETLSSSHALAPPVPPIACVATPSSGGSANDRSPLHRAVLTGVRAIEPDIAEHRAGGIFRFDESFLGFDGHFPGEPILPGIIMLEMALVLCEAVRGQPVTLSGVEQVKFSGSVLPEQDVRIEVFMTPVAGGWNVKASLARGEATVAYFRMSVT